MRFHSAVVLASLTTAVQIESQATLSQDFNNMTDFELYIYYFRSALEALERDQFWKDESAKAPHSS